MLHLIINYILSGARITVFVVDINADYAALFIEKVK